MFYNDTAQKLPFVIEIQDNFDEVRQEIYDFIDTGKAFLPYMKYSYTDPISNDVRESLFQNDWKVFSITQFNWDGIDESAHRPFKNEVYNRFVKIVYRKCKKLRSILKQYEDIGAIRNGMVSRLAPGTIIHPHRGWKDSVLRVHICLKEDLNCAITVNDQTQVWKENQVLSFVDYDIHSVEHSGSEERIIISLDTPFEFVRKYDGNFSR